MKDVPESLLPLAEQVKAGKRPRITLRKLLEEFGQSRRGSLVNQRIEEALGRLELKTEPDFRHVYLDEKVHLYPVEGTPPTEPDEGSTEDGKVVDVATPGYFVRRFVTEERRKRGIVSVNPNATLQEAFMLMLQWDFSQVPVMQSARDVRGVFSWRSFGQAHVGASEALTHVRDCMVAPVHVEEHDQMSTLIDRVQAHDVVLIRNRAQEYVTVFTAADLADLYRDVSESFVLLGEIEDHVRSLVRRGGFSVEELSAVRHADDEREIKRVEDLTFGSYVNLLGRPDNWTRLGIKLDRTAFIKELDLVRELRNAVMHFDPDGLTSEQVGQLRRFCGLMRVVG